MEPYKEKRQYERYEYHCPINMYLIDDQDHSYYAEMEDYSQGGISMVTNKKLVEGHIVHLQMEESDTEAIGATAVKGHTGCVKWVIPSSTDEAVGQYKCGLEYFS